MSDVGSARKAKDELKVLIGSEPWCAGIGVERSDGLGFVVRVSIRPGITAEERARIPEKVGNVVVQVIDPND